MNDSIRDLIVGRREVVMEHIDLPANTNMSNQCVVETTTDRIGERALRRQWVKTARTDVAYSDQEVREGCKAMKGHRSGWPKKQVVNCSVSAGFVGLRKTGSVSGESNPAIEVDGESSIPSLRVVGH